MTNQKLRISFALEKSVIKIKHPQLQSSLKSPSGDLGVEKKVKARAARAHKK